MIKAHEIDGSLEGNTFEVQSPGAMAGVLLIMRYPTFVHDLRARKKLVWRIKGAVRVEDTFLEAPKGVQGPQSWVGFPRAVLTPIPSQQTQIVAVAYAPTFLDGWSDRVKLYQFTFSSPQKSREEREDPDRRVWVWGAPIMESSAAVGLFKVPFRG